MSCLAYRIVRGDAAGTTLCSFRMFQSPKFSTVVFTPEELKYWDRSATARTPFVPTLVHLESEYETHTILLRNPSDDSLLPVVKKIGFVYSKRRYVNAMPISEASLRLIMQRGSGGASLLVRRQPNQEKRLGFLSCRISMPLKWTQVSITLTRFFGAAMSQRLRKQSGWLVTPRYIGEQ